MTSKSTIKTISSEDKEYQRIMNKYESGEPLSKKESEYLQKEIQNFTENIDTIGEGITKAMVQGITKPLSEVTQAMVQGITNDSINLFSGISNVVKPFLDGLDKQYKENPLTQKEIEEYSKFFQDFIEERKQMTFDILNMQAKQYDIYQAIFKESQANETDLAKYKNENAEIDMPFNIFDDISRSYQGKAKRGYEIEELIQSYLMKKIPKKLKEKLDSFNKDETQDNLDLFIESLPPTEAKKIQEALNELSEEIVILQNRPSRMEKDHLEWKHELEKKLIPRFFIYQNNSDIHFENVSKESFIKYMNEEIELLSKAIKTLKKVNSSMVKITNIFSRSGNPYFEGRKEEELSENERQILDELKENSFALLQGMTQTESLFRQIFIKEEDYQKKDIEYQERFGEFLQSDLEDLQDLLKEYTIETEKIKQFKPIPIDKVVSFNDKISNNFTHLENKTYNSIANTGGKKKSLKDSDIQIYIENGKMNTSNPLEQFDKIVLQTIYSVLQENMNFDIQMLRKAMSGISNRNGTKLDDDIEKSINKLWTTLIEIKIPEELKQTFKDTDFEWESIKGNLLPLIEIKGKKGGKKVKLYGLESKSIYFSYVKARGQLQTKDTKLLQIGTATKENVLIVDYLTTRIEDMKHKKNCDDNLKNIKLESIWELIETEEDKAMSQKSLNQKRKRREKDIEEILKNYVSIKYIKNYSKTKTGFKIEI